MADQDLSALRARFAREICRDAAVSNEQLERAFATLPRENYLTPPPWRIFSPGGLIEKITSDPADLYEDVLVTLDGRKGINNGQPSLHAAWLDSVDPKPGETAVHVGTGSGYYTALLSDLVGPGGAVHGYEIDTALAAVSRQNLRTHRNVGVHGGSGVAGALPEADVVYVNAGAGAPDPSWLTALKSGGRLIFPWQRTPRGGGITFLVTRTTHGFAVRLLMAVGFIPLVGDRTRPAPRRGQERLEETQSVWLASERRPDETATAIFDEVWFSREAVA